MRIVVCESVVRNTDNTYQLVRYGIDRFPNPSLPFRLAATIFVECAPGELALGEHKVDFEMTAPINHGGVGSGVFTVTDESEPFRTSFPFDVPIDGPGVVLITVRAGAREASATVTIGASASRPGTGSGN